MIKDEFQRMKKNEKYLDMNKMRNRKRNGLKRCFNKGISEGTPHDAKLSYLSWGSPLQNTTNNN